MSNEPSSKPRQARRDLTPEEKADARRLKAEWQAYKQGHRGATQEWLGREANIGGQQAAEQYLNGRIPLNLDAVIAFARALGIPPERISPTRARQIALASADAMTTIGTAGVLGLHEPAPEPIASTVPTMPALSARPMGVRIVIVPMLGHAGDVHMPQALPVCLDTFGSELNSRADHLACMRLELDDDSMVPTLYPGDVLLIDTNEPVRGDHAAHALRWRGRLVVRRVLPRADGGYHLTGDNPTSKPIAIPADEARELEILGRIVMRMGTAFLMP